MSGRARAGARSALRLRTLAGTAAAATVLLASAPGAGEAQSVRGWARTTVRYVQLRPLSRDTIPLDSVTARAGDVDRFRGQPVACTPGLHCTLFRMEPVDHVLHGTQDVSLTAWGLGLQGLSATTLFRVRSDLAGDFTWPRSDDPFDAMLAYVQLARGPVRLRMGRQDARSSLGFASFDGASARWSALDRLQVEAYGGRSLARGLREPRHEALRGLQRFVPDQEAYLFGGTVEGEPVPGTGLTLRYQREIWSDRSALISERAALGLRSATLAPLVVDGKVDYDFAFGRPGKAHLSVRYPLTRWSVQTEATLRRYVPYFELHTIWGFFNPVAYHEAELRSSWWSSPSLAIWVAGARRWYGDARATNAFVEALEPLEGTAWRASAGFRWRPIPGWTLDGGYRLEAANGGSLSSGDLSVGWTPDPRLRLTANATALQQVEEFRFGDATTVGAGGTAHLQLTSRLRLDTGVSVYRRMDQGRLFEVEEDWSQIRGWSSLRVELGSDPGLEGGR